MNGKRDNHRVELSDRVALATLLTQRFERLFIERARDIRWVDFREDPLLLAEKACLFRQHQALRAALTLNEASFGHLAVAFVRPACDEYIWLSYLSSIDRVKANQLFFAFSLSESFRSLEAQQKFIGADQMIAFGFPARFLAEIASWPVQAKTMIKELAKELGWPGDKAKIPSVKWFAEKTNSENLYDFLYSATSRTLHFSASEIARRAWGEGGESSIIRLDQPSYIEYRLEFALYWQVYLLSSTLEVVNESSGFEISDTELTEILDIIERWNEIGMMPLITPQEMNLTQEKRLPWLALTANRARYFSKPMTSTHLLPQGSSP